METFIVLLVFTMLLIDFGLNLFLSIINYRYSSTKIPDELSDVYDLKKYSKWKTYYAENFRISIFSMVTKFIVIVTLLISDCFLFIDGFAKSITMKLSFQVLVVIGFYFLLLFIIDLVFSYYSTFKIEDKFGFNKMNKKLFFIDKIKSLIFTIVLGGGMILGIISLYINLEKLFFIIAWLSAIVIMIIINLSYTTLIIPIFNKLKPLEESSLKTKIFDFAEGVGYEISKISVMDASKRSSKLNAFFSGFGKSKRIVLYDTLIEKCTEEEIVAVLAHEIGHNKHKHIIFNMLQSIVMLSIYILGLMLFLNSPIFSIAFGFSQINYGFNMILYFVILKSILIFVGLLTNSISRKFEYQADLYAAKEYSDIEVIKVLKVLSGENFSNLTPHPLYIKFFYSHPSLYQRIQNIKTIKKDKF